MCRNGYISLEANSKGKLHRARAADLKEGTQLAQGVARAESVGKRLGGGAKARTGREEGQLPGITRIAGISEVGMIETLNASARSCRLRPSDTRNSRWSEKSICHAARPRKTLRPRSPSSPLGGIENALLLKLLPPGKPGP